MRSETFFLKNVLHANKYLKRHDAALTYKSEHKIALGLVGNKGNMIKKTYRKLL